MKIKRPKWSMDLARRPSSVVVPMESPNERVCFHRSVFRSATRIILLGPNNEGCNETTVTMVTDLVNVTETVREQDNATDFTTVTALDISTENITLPESSTESGNLTTEEFVQQTSTELATERTTIREVQTTTEQMTTMALPKTCADTEHQCCPDGVSAAKVTNFFDGSKVFLTCFALIVGSTISGMQYN